MAKRCFWLGLLATMLLCGMLSMGCVTQVPRDIVWKSAIMLQRTRASEQSDTPMKIFIDEVPYTIANGEVQSLIVNNGEHVAYAVLGNWESKTVKFTTASKTVYLYTQISKKLLRKDELIITALTVP